MFRRADLLISKNKSHRTLLLERLEDRSLLTAGMLDPTFGDGGKLLTTFADSPHNRASAMAVQGDGKIVVAGFGAPFSSRFTLAAVRYNADGSLDNGFGVGGFVTIDEDAIDVPPPSLINPSPVIGLVLQPDGRIVAGYSVVGATVDFAVARLNSDGSWDTTFNGSGKQAIDFGSSHDYARDVVIQPDGKIVVAGGTRDDFDFAVARLNPDGTPDATFGSGGKTTVDFGPYIQSTHFDFFVNGYRDVGTSVVLQSDGKIVVGGFNPGFLDGTLLEVVRFETDGGLDSTFGDGGYSVHATNREITYSSLAIGTGGQMLMGGNFLGEGIVVLQLGVNGDFGGGATVSGLGVDFHSDLAVQANGQILVVGTPQGFGTIQVVRLNGDFTLDDSFGDAGRKTIAFAPENGVGVPASVVVQPDGRIMVVGTVGSFLALARLASDGIFDAPFADSDRDGIEDSVDSQPTAFSNGFSDVANGGATSGSIVSRGQQVLFVEDEPTTDGVLISAHPLGGGAAATVSIEGGAANLTLGAGDQVIATHGSVILHVLAGTIEATLTADSGEVATVNLIAGNGLTFEPESFTFIAPDTNTQPVHVVFNGSELTVSPGETVAPTTVRTVTVDIAPESLNIDSNGAISVLIFGAADFDAGRVDVSSVRFAGAAATHSDLVDANHDGRLDLQLKFRRQDTILERVYADLLSDDHDADGVHDSTRQVAEVSVTGETIDDLLFSGSDDISLFLAGRKLRELLDTLFA